MATTFTFFAEGDRIEIRIVEFETRSKVEERDAVWLDSTVTVQAGAFIGSFKASFTTDNLRSNCRYMRGRLLSYRFAPRVSCVAWVGFPSSFH